MNTPHPSRFTLNTLFLATLACYAPLALANPNGASVVSGSASFQQQGNSLVVTNTPGAIINWAGFSIGRDELTRFVQQNANSAVLNRVTGQDPSQILGQLQSNGRVFLINPNGIVFGQGARVDTAGLVASTLNISDADFKAGKLKFTGAGNGSIQNAAHITTPGGGFVYLIAPSVENSGVIVSPKGEILLAGGQSVELVDGVDTSLRVKLDVPAGQVLNVGQLIAEQGRIGVFAAAIRQQGLVSANRVEQGEGGRIVFKASGGDVVLAAGSVTEAQGGQILADAGRGDMLLNGRVDVSNSQGKGGEAQLLGGRVGLFGSARVDASGRDGGGTVLVGGDYQGKNAAIHNASQTVLAGDASIDASATGSGNGGRVIVWSDGHTVAQGNIAARGGIAGGDGGFVEVSGKDILDFYSKVDTTAAMGKLGTLLLDPTDLDVIDCGSSCGFSLPIIAFGDIPGSGSSTILGATISSATTNVSLQATNSINFYDPVSIATAGKSLTAEAGNAINVYNTIYAPSAVTLKAPSIYVSSNVDAGSKVHMLADGLTISGGCGALVNAPTVTIEPYSAGFGLEIGGCGAGSMLTISTGTLGGIDGNATLNLLGSTINLNTTLNRVGDTVLVANSSFNSTVANMSIGGRYLVYTSDPTTSNRNGAGSYSKHYGVSYSGTTPSYATSGNWFLYSITPTLTVTPDGGTVSYGSALPTGYTVGTAGLIDSDTPTTIGLNGTPTFLVPGAVTTGSGNTAAGTYGITYGSGLLSSLGYQFVSGTGSVVVTPVQLNLSGSIGSKVYDGTVLAKLSGTTSLTGLLAGDVVSLAGSGSFLDKNVGNAKPVNVTGATLQGADAGNYVLASASGTLVGDITPAMLTLSGILAANKVYDGNTSATLSSYGTLGGLIAGDDVQVSGGSGVFVDKNVGTGKAVTVTGIQLAGLDAGNYTLASHAGTGQADITRAALVSWTGAASGNWSDPANWANGAVPDFANVASVSLPAGTSVVFDAAAGTVQLDALNSAGRIVMSGGQLDVTGALTGAQWQQSGGTVQVGSMTISQLFSQTGGSIAQLGSGTLSLTQASGDLVLGDIRATNGSFTAAGNISQTSSLKISGQTRLNGGAITLTQAGNDLGTVTGTASGAVQLQDDVGDLTLAQLTSQGSVRVIAAGNLLGSGSGPNLQATTGDLQAGGAITGLNLAVDQLSVKAAGNVAVSNQKATQLLLATVGGDLRLETFGGLSTSGPVVATGAVDLITHSPLLIGSGGVTAASITLLSVASASGNDNVTINGNLAATSGACDVQAGGSILQNANITTQGGAIRMAALGGDLIMAPGASSFSNGGAIAYSALGNMSLALLDAGSGAISLRSNQGSIVPTTAGVLNVRSGGLDASAGGSIVLQADVPQDRLLLQSGAGLAIIRGPDGTLLVGSTVGGLNNSPDSGGVVINAVNNLTDINSTDSTNPANQSDIKKSLGKAGNDDSKAKQEKDDAKTKKLIKC
ncbi:beta strand repeat-containing protein [Chitinimonas naiadis]